MDKVIAIKKMMVAAVLMVGLASFAAADTTLKVVGQATMSWLFMDIYQATLFSVDGSYQPKHYPQALTIVYYRDVSREALLKATEQQWQHLGISANSYQPWLTKLGKLWPDINQRDQLSYVVLTNGQGDFYHNGNWLGRIADANLSDAFLSIWLSPNSSEPKLRKKLIGEK